MSEHENPEFGFLNELKKTSDSAILDKEEAKSDTKPEQSEPEKPPESSTKQSQPAWMDEPETLEDRYDSSMRFAAALGTDDDSNKESLLNLTGEDTHLTDEQEQSAEDEPEQLELTSSDSDEQTTDEDRDSSNKTSTVAENAEVPETTEKDAPASSIPLTKSPPAVAATTSVVNAPVTTSVQEPVVSKRKYMIVLSYASAITLVCVILIMQSLQAKPHDLESLPDLKPPMKDDEIAYRLVPEAAGLPRGHTLKLGQSRRFGNVLVTPTKVVYEPIQFVHYSQDPTKTRAASKPAMKLWLKFENVSKDQKFAPLDRKLMLMRIVDPKQREFMRSNQFLCPSRAKGDLKKTSLLYDLEMVGDWDFAGIEDDPLVPPGQTLEIYLPSSEEAYDEMDGKITWRVQFRKGYNPDSKRGVTTLIEVVFDKKEVISS